MISRLQSSCSLVDCFSHKQAHFCEITLFQTFFLAEKKMGVKKKTIWNHVSENEKNILLSSFFLDRNFLVYRNGEVFVKMYNADFFFCLKPIIRPGSRVLPKNLMKNHILDNGKKLLPLSFLLPHRVFSHGSRDFLLKTDCFGFIFLSEKKS